MIVVTSDKIRQIHSKCLTKYLHKTEIKINKNFPALPCFSRQIGEYNEFLFAGSKIRAGNKKLALIHGTKKKKDVSFKI